MRKLLYISLFTLLAACQPEPLIVDDVPQAPKKMAVSSVLVTQTALSVIVTNSYGALAGDLEEDNSLINNYLVTDAEVKVSHDNVDYFMEELTPGFYVSNQVFLNDNETYELEVYNPETNETARSAARVKESVRFNDVEVEMETGSLDTLIRVKYSFQDIPGENYYMVNIQKASQRIRSAEDVVSNRVYTHLVNDQDIVDGSLVEDEFIALFRQVSFQDTLLVSFSHISFEYYDYLDRVNNGFLGPSLITEPYNYPTNVENGYGFFNLHYQDNRIRVLEN